MLLVDADTSWIIVLSKLSLPGAHLHRIFSSSQNISLRLYYFSLLFCGCKSMFVHIDGCNAVGRYLASIKSLVAIVSIKPQCTQKKKNPLSRMAKTKERVKSCQAQVQQQIHIHI